MKQGLKSQLTVFIAGVVLPDCSLAGVDAFSWANGTGVSPAKGIPSEFKLADADWRVALKGRGTRRRCFGASVFLLPVTIQMAAPRISSA